MTERELSTAALLAWHSLRLSGIELAWETVAEFYRTGRVTAYTGSVQALRELSNHKLCQELLRAELENESSPDARLIRKVNRTLTQETVPNIGETVALRLLTAEPDESDALRDAAVFLLRFQVLRPFQTGNDQTARMIMNYRLALRDEPPILLPAEERAQLTACLEAEDTDALTDFLREQGERLKPFDGHDIDEKGAQMNHEL